MRMLLLISDGPLCREWALLDPSTGDVLSLGFSATSVLKEAREKYGDVEPDVEMMSGAVSNKMEGTT